MMFIDFLIVPLSFLVILLSFIVLDYFDKHKILSFYVIKIKNKLQDIGILK